MDERSAVYENYFSQTGGAVKLNNVSEQWLYQDDTYMAAQLRESVSEVKTEFEEPVSDEQVPYSAEDLFFCRC